MCQTIESVNINIETEFVGVQPGKEEQFVFSYHITITNHSELNLQLLSRSWLITDANGEVTSVEGEGVVGQQPHFTPDEQYQYSSGCVLKTPIGSMQGYYYFVDSHGEEYKAAIPIFTLAKPNALN